MREIQANIDRPMALQNYLRRTFPSVSYTHLTLPTT